MTGCVNQSEICCSLCDCFNVISSGFVRGVNLMSIIMWIMWIVFMAFCINKFWHVSTFCLGTVFSTYFVTYKQKFIISDHVVETNILDTSLVKVLESPTRAAGCWRKGSRTKTYEQTFSRRFIMVASLKWQQTHKLKSILQYPLPTTCLWN